MNEEFVRFMIESESATLERTISRLWKLCIIIFLAFIVSNGLWLAYEYQWKNTETVITEQTVDQENESGDNQFVGGNYGTSESSDKNNTH